MYQDHLSDNNIIHVYIYIYLLTATYTPVCLVLCNGVRLQSIGEPNLSTNKAKQNSRYIS